MASTFQPCALTPSRQPEQTAPAVRKAFERLGNTEWSLGTLAVHDPQQCYAPPSKLNEARRDALAALTDAYTQLRAAHLSAIPSFRHSAIPQRLGGTPSPYLTARQDAVALPLWTLKTRLGAPRPDDTLAFDTVVLAIGHTPDPEQALTQWAGRRPRLALPLISCDPERDTLRQTVARLIAEGWTDWECADLAGYHLLRTLGITPASSDWSLYALNRVAVAELAHLGIQSFVLSPELDLATIRLLADSTPVPELIVYQHTPLFISETAPCFPEATPEPPLTLLARRKQTLVTQHLDGRWVTANEAPLCLAGHLAETTCTRFRIDLSWSPDPLPDALPEILHALRANTPLPATHTANLTRGLV